MRRNCIQIRIAGLILLVSHLAFADQKIEQAIKIQEKTNTDASAAQARIDNLSDDTRRMLEEYKLTLRKIEDLKSYNKHLKNLIESQKNELLKYSDEVCFVY